MPTWVIFRLTLVILVDIHANLNDIHANLSDIQANVSDIQANLSDIQANLSYIHAHLSDIHANLSNIQANMCSVCSLQMPYTTKGLNYRQLSVICWIEFNQKSFEIVDLQTPGGQTETHISTRCFHIRNILSMEGLLAPR